MVSKMIFFTGQKKSPIKFLLLFQYYHFIQTVLFFKSIRVFVSGYRKLCSLEGVLPRKAVINVYSWKILKLDISIFGN